MRRKPAKRRTTEPLNVRLPARTRAKLAVQAKTRGVDIEVAAGALIDERLRELDDARDLKEAQDWQRERALVTLDKIRAGDCTEASEEEIEADFAEALHAARTRRPARSA